MNVLKGPEGFNQFYADMYGERWPRLKEALLAPKKHVAVANPWSHFKFAEQPLVVNGLSFEHDVRESFPQPEATHHGYMNYYLLDAASILCADAIAVPKKAFAGITFEWVEQSLADARLSFEQAREPE